MKIIVPNTLSQFENMIISHSLENIWKVPDYSAGVFMYQGNMIHRNGHLYRCLENSKDKAPEIYEELWFDWGVWDNVNGQEYNGGTYAIDALVTHSSSYRHFIYKATQEIFVGETPSANPDKWINIGAVNLYRNLYGKTENKTEVTGNQFIEYASNKADYFNIVGLNAQSITVEVRDSANKLLQTTTQDLIRKGARTLKEFWFKDFSYKNTFSVKLPLGFNNKIKVMLNSTGISRIGNTTLGRSFYVGSTLWDPRAGIIDFSKIIRDEQFGDIDVKQGSYAKRANLVVFVDSNRSDEVFDFLTSVRGKEVLLVGDNKDNGFDLLTVRCILKDWDVTLKGPMATEITVYVEGLI